MRVSIIDSTPQTTEQRIQKVACIAMQMFPGLAQDGEAEALLADAIRRLHQSHGQAAEQVLTVEQREALVSGYVPECVLARCFSMRWSGTLHTSATIA